MDVNAQFSYWERPKLRVLSDRQREVIYRSALEVLERTGGKVHLWPATLYGSIKRLMEADLIAESAERPLPAFDDARRRYYKLTALGRSVLDAECARLQELVDAIRGKQASVSEAS